MLKIFKGQPESYGLLFTQEQLECLKRWDRPGGLVNLETRDPALRQPEFLPLDGAGERRPGAGEVNSMGSEIKRLTEGGKWLGGDLHDAGPAQRQDRG